MSNEKEIKRLLLVELGERTDPFGRLVAVFVAGALIALYTGWPLAWVWPLHFLAAFGIHTLYLSTRGARVSRGELFVATGLFAHLQASYAWMPALMIVDDDRALVLAGGSLLGAQLVFLLRRSDTVQLYAVAQSVVIGLVSVILYLGHMRFFEGPLAYIGAAVALAALNYYFLMSLRVARRMRLRSRAANERSAQAQKMAAIGQLAGGIAHDFNNNLTAIIGSLELMQEIDDPTEQRKDLENALTAARQAAKTVKQLLIFARVERQDLIDAAIDDLISELTSLTERLIPASITLDLKVAPMTQVLRADRHQLLAGLINLIVNSVDAMPDGGTLSLHVEAVDAGHDLALADGDRLTPGRYARITVSDTGHGIPADLLTKVVDPFFTTKPVGKGTGLGLSMVLGLSRELGGGLGVRSDARGTSVDLYLPLRAAGSGVATRGIDLQPGDW